MEILKHTLVNLSKAQKTLILGLSLSAMMLVVAIFSKEGFVTVHEFEEELRLLTDHNERLSQENERLREDVEGLKNDPYQVERIAREKLNLVKSGELVYQIVPPEVSSK